MHPVKEFMHFDVYPKDDRAQALRIKRFFMAGASYTVWCFISLFTFLLGITQLSLYVLIGYSQIEKFILGISQHLAKLLIGGNKLSFSNIQHCNAI